MKGLVLKEVWGIVHIVREAKVVRVRVWIMTRRTIHRRRNARGGPTKWRRATRRWATRRRWTQRRRRGPKSTQ